MNQATALLGLLAESSIHAGAGQAIDVVDLPIQRESHTDWPCIHGSAVKGAMRNRAFDLGMDPDLLWAIFGPETANASDHAGGLTVSDARLLLLPVRSLTTHFRATTCPALLRRLERDLRWAGLGPESTALGTVTAALGSVASEEVIVAKDKPPRIYLEELIFAVKAKEKDVCAPLAALLAWLLPAHAKPMLEEQLAIVSDDRFRHLCRHAVPVVPHVALDPETKTVKDKALWFEETLPPETVMYTLVASDGGRRKSKPLSAKDLLDQMSAALFPTERSYLRVGGNETVGMGWFSVRRTPAA